MSRGPIRCSGNTFVLRVRLENRRVSRAWSTGRMVRNTAVLLKNETDSQGRPQFVQQAHCICNDAHALAAVRAIEDLAGLETPPGARLVRSLVQAARLVQDHMAHVYQFHLADWADPDEGRLPIHGHATWALEARVCLDRALGLLGFSAAGCRAYEVGGLPPDMDLGPAVLEELAGLVTQCRDFVEQTMLLDLADLAHTHADQTHAGQARVGRSRALLCLGDLAPADLHEDGPKHLFPAGLLLQNGDGGLASPRPARLGDVSEEAVPDQAGEDARCYGLIPGPDGRPIAWPNNDFQGPTAPRMNGLACEVGPSARLLAACARGHGPVLGTARRFMNTAGLPLEALNSSLGRFLARGVESAVLVQTAGRWLEALERHRHADDLRGSHAPNRPWTLPDSGTGTGRVEVARGSLTHTIRLDDGRIERHDTLIPSLWNFSPRDGHGVPGPLEAALEDMEVADPEQPVEIMRVIHGMDPCNPCLVLVEDCGRTLLVNAP